MRVGAVIAAAGTPGGFAAYDNTGVADGVGMVKRMIQNFQRAGAADIVVVTGYKAEETEKQLAKMGVVFLRSPDYEREQMIDFASRGLQYLAKTCQRIFFCPVSVPLFSVDTICEMMRTPGSVIIPVCGGRRGHPVLIMSDLVPSISAYRGRYGLKGAIDASGGGIIYHEIDDGGISLRVQDQEAFASKIAREGIQQIHPKVKLQFIKNIPFFGPGVVHLLKQIDILGEIRAACQKTGISYSKGRNMISIAEENLNCTIVERSVGGAGGGKAKLTEKGKRIVEQYEQYERAVSEYADEMYQKYFSDL